MIKYGPYLHDSLKHVCQWQEWNCDILGVWNHRYLHLHRSSVSTNFRSLHEFFFTPTFRMGKEKKTKKKKHQKPLHFSCTSMVLSTPAASATTFSWVSIAPLGFPDKWVQWFTLKSLNIKRSAIHFSQNVFTPFPSQLLWIIGQEEHFPYMLPSWYQDTFPKDSLTKHF